MVSIRINSIFVVLLFFVLFSVSSAAALTPNASLPQLPAQGAKLDDFVPKGWQLKDSTEFDFNNDGLMDIAAVVEIPADLNRAAWEDAEDAWFPRILFVLQNTGKGYTLSIQDENAVRAWDEGGIWGDPYEPLTVNDDAFTVNAYGGSNWRWNEQHTYKYRDNRWVLTQAESAVLFGGEPRSEYTYDYEQGIGKRMEMNDCGKSVAYTVKLGPPPELKAYNLNLARPNLPPELPFTVKAYKTVPGVNTANIRVPEPPNNKGLSNHLLNTNDYVVYRFFTPAAEYLAVYHKAEAVVYVVAQLDKTRPNTVKSVFENAAFHNGRIYFSQIYGWRETELTPEGFLTSHYTAELVSINPNGDDCLTVFKHELETTEEYVYLTLISEFSDNEDIVSVINQNTRLFYRLNLKTLQYEMLGELPACTEQDFEAHQRELMEAAPQE